MGRLQRIFGTLQWTPPKWSDGIDARRIAMAVLATAILAALAVGRPTVQSGSSDDDPIGLHFERTLFDEFAVQKAAASASALVLADGMLGYREAFPHACAERIVSKVFP